MLLASVACSSMCIPCMRSSPPPSAPPPPTPALLNTPLRVMRRRRQGAERRGGGERRRRTPSHNTPTPSRPHRHRLLRLILCMHGRGCSVWGHVRAALLLLTKYDIFTISIMILSSRGRRRGSESRSSRLTRQCRAHQLQRQARQVYTSACDPLRPRRTAGAVTAVTAVTARPTVMSSLIFSFLLRLRRGCCGCSSGPCATHHPMFLLLLLLPSRGRHNTRQVMCCTRQHVCG